MKFSKICLDCQKTYVNSTMNICGGCRLKLTDIHLCYVSIDKEKKLINIVYKFD